jgi:transposase
VASGVTHTDARIDELERKVQFLLLIVEKQAKRIDALEVENAELKAKLGQNSQNSSKPPSSDSPDTQRPKPLPKGRKRGGQPGHVKRERQRLPPDHVIDHKPERCRLCAAALFGEDPNAKWCQVLELPEVKPQVTEYRAHALSCADCGAVTEATLPDEALLHGFGPRLAAVTAYLTGRCRLSKRQASEILEEVFGTPMSTGAVCAVEQDVSVSLRTPVEEARKIVRQQPAVHLDETGWREDKKRAWLWVAVTSIATVFQVARSRGSKVAREILGESFQGTITTDRWSAYTWVDVLRRQLCWAHLLRDFTGMTERDAVGARLAAEILGEVEKMFDWWHRVREGTLPRVTFQKLMEPVRARVGDLLREASTSAGKKTAGMCREILALEPALWTFVDVVGVEPTNNAAERAIRPAVLWRKGSFGNDSDVGSRFTERILTAVATLRQHGRPVLVYLTEACAAARAGHAIPSLILATAK